MKKEALIRKIRRRARQDEGNRQDRRFLDTMGFLVAKGLLKTNMPIDLLPNKRLRIDDVIWAGQKNIRNLSREFRSPPVCFIRFWGSYSIL